MKLPKHPWLCYNVQGNGVETMNAFILMLPFFFLRLIVLPARNKAAGRRAGESAPLYTDGEKFAGNIYQLTSVAIFIYPVFMRVEFDYSWMFWVGAVLYIIGIVLLGAAVIAFAAPDEKGMATGGVYKLSRHPMYVSYFLVFLGITSLTKSPLLLSLVVVNQLTAHWVILAEERMCANEFGEAYEAYMKKVRRYI